MLSYIIFVFLGTFEKRIEKHILHEHVASFIKERGRDAGGVVKGTWRGLGEVGGDHGNLGGGGGDTERGLGGVRRGVVGRVG